MPSRQSDNTLNRYLPFIVLGAILVGSAAYKDGKFSLENISKALQGGGSSPDPAPAGPTAPTPELQALVAPIVTLAKGNAMAPRAGKWHRDAASVIRDDKTVVTSTGQLLSWIKDTNTLSVQGTPVVGAIPGLAAARGAILDKEIGLDDKPLDDATRKRFADILDAIGWALGG